MFLHIMHDDVILYITSILNLNHLSIISRLPNIPFKKYIFTYLYFSVTNGLLLINDNSSMQNLILSNVVI